MPRPSQRVLGAGHPRTAELRRLLKKPRPAGQVLIEGPRAAGEALDHGLVPLTVMVPDDAGTAPAVADVLDRLDAATELLVMRRSVFDKLARTVTPQPMLALFDRPCGLLPETVGGAEVWLVLAGVGDPGNSGTLIRAAEALGAAGVVAAGGADPWAPKTVRASAGSVLRMPPAERDLHDALRALRSAGARIVAADPHRGELHDSGVLEPPLAIVVGSEPHGLVPAAEPLVDAWCRIDMAGSAESLNVAMAGTLLLHEACRRPGGRDHADPDRHDPAGADRRPRASEGAEAHLQEAPDRQARGGGDSDGA